MDWRHNVAFGDALDVEETVVDDIAKRDCVLLHADARALSWTKQVRPWHAGELVDHCLATCMCKVLLANLW